MHDSKTEGCKATGYVTLSVAFHSACYLSGYYVYPDSASLWSELLEAIGSQTRQHSSLDVQAVSCYTEEKQSQEGEGDEKDTLCVSRHYLQKPLKSPVISRFFRFEGSATTPLLHQ